MFNSLLIRVNKIIILLSLTPLINQINTHKKEQKRNKKLKEIYS